MFVRSTAAALAAAFFISGPVAAHPGDLDTWEQYRKAKLEDSYKHLPDPESRASAVYERKRDRIVATLRSDWEKFDAAYWASLEPEQIAVAGHAHDPEPQWSIGPFAIPTYIVMCESGGDYRAENDSSSASGAYQIVDGSWAGYGGYSHASYAPPSVQDAKAAEMWAGGAGAHHWAACL